MPAGANSSDSSKPVPGQGPTLSASRASAQSTFNVLVQKIQTLEVEVDELLDFVRHARAKIEGEIKSSCLLLREEAAELLQLSPATLDRLTKAGKIPTTHLDSRPRYSPALLQEYVGSRTFLPKSHLARGNKAASPANKKKVNQDLKPREDGGLEL